MRKIMLCGREKCCPEIHLDGEHVFIVDDDDNRVVMTNDQFRILKDKIEDGEFDSVCAG